MLVVVDFAPVYARYAAPEAIMTMTTITATTRATLPIPVFLKFKLRKDQSDVS
ncbi:MAG TPA: hypothetical protein VED17_00310 [Nitrososphaerales archaeon]|nr:hypothetical protein [Nitrososphaerales archaeon]